MRWLVQFRRDGNPEIAASILRRLRARLFGVSAAQLLHCRVRYLTDGVAIGSKALVEIVFQAHRSRFGPQRSTGARPLRWGDSGGPCALRDLQKEVVRPPGG